MATNKEWLKSLSDAQLDEEIRWGRVRADDSPHKESAQRNLEEARLEKLAREQDRR